MRYTQTIILMIGFLLVTSLQGQIRMDDPFARDREEQGFGFGGGIGAVTINGELYTAITLRPDFSLGKFGVALDLPFYINADGDFRTEEWNHWNDVPDKIYYLRYGRPDDPFYLRAGALDDVTLGYGLIVNQYSNTVDYPDIRRIGGRINLESGPFGIHGFVANFKEINGPGLLGGRITYDGFGPFVIGATLVSDINPYEGLADEDNDNYPDRVDDFPNDDDASLDSDGDGIPDMEDLDRDGDGWADNPDADETGRLRDLWQQGDTLDYNVETSPEPFNIAQADAPTITEVGADIGLPLPFLQSDWSSVFLYAQSALMLPEENTIAGVDSNGWGVGAPGFRIDITPPVNIALHFGIEYRIFSKYFAGEFFNRSYDLERVKFRRVTTPNGDDSLVVETKASRLLPQITDRMSGIYSSFGIDLFDLVRLRSVYQDYQGNVSDRSFYGAIHLNTRMIPKISSAYAYYHKSHIIDENLFETKDESTVLGYRLAYELTTGVHLVLGYRETYVDKDGNGQIEGKEETVSTTSLETVFRF